LSHVDPMRAIILIPKSKPPKLDTSFSVAIREFVDFCLCEEPNDVSKKNEPHTIQLNFSWPFSISDGMLMIWPKPNLSRAPARPTSWFFGISSLAMKNGKRKTIQTNAGVYYRTILVAGKLTNRNNSGTNQNRMLMVLFSVVIAKIPLWASLNSTMIAGNSM
jgi:hypothetical protein